MQCSCGGYIKASSHLVRTQDGIHSWLGHYYPQMILVEQNRCDGCGRLEARFFDSVTKGELHKQK
jgi:hypothetical protein